MKALLFVAIDFDDKITGAETVATALDQLLKTALSTPSVLDDCGNPRVSEFFALPDEELRAAKANLDELQQQINAVKSALAVSEWLN